MSSNLNAFNRFLTQATESIMCGPDCQREKTIQELQQNINTAKTNQAMGPYNVEMAVKNYITYTKGESAYNDYNEARLTKQAKGIATSMQTSFNENAKNTSEMIQQYSGLLNNYEYIVELYNNYLIKNKELEKEIKKMDSDVLTNNRKTYYEDQQIDVLNSYYWLFLILYMIIWILFILFIFVFPSRLTKFKLIGIGFLLLIYPHVATGIFIIIYKIYNSITSVLPKNVYKDLADRNTTIYQSD
jgi:hypothetical protein